MSKKLTTPSVKAQPQSRDARQRVCAVIVAYYPDPGFQDRLHRLLPQVDAVVVVDNTPGGTESWMTKTLTRDTRRVRAIVNRTNLGVATALNQGLEHALHVGCQWLLTLDQDTQCYSDMVQTMLEVAASCEPKPAVIGGNYFDAKRGRHEAPIAPRGNCSERKTVITSGCLIEASFAQTVGGFRDDYFIDQVDHEFCLRARAHGKRVVITRKPVMDHSVGGHTGPKVPLLGWMLPDHSALRKYYITRNSVVTIRIYWKSEPVWCLKRLIRLFAGLGSMAVLEKDKITKVRAFAAGIRDALNDHMGPSQKAWLRQG